MKKGASITTLITALLCLIVGAFIPDTNTILVGIGFAILYLATEC